MTYGNIDVRVIPEEQDSDEDVERDEKDIMKAINAALEKAGFGPDQFDVRLR